MREVGVERILIKRFLGCDVEFWTKINDREMRSFGQLVDCTDESFMILFRGRKQTYSYESVVMMRELRRDEELLEDGS